MLREAVGLATQNIPETPQKNIITELASCLEKLETSVNVLRFSPATIDSKLNANLEACRLVEHCMKERMATDKHFSDIYAPDTLTLPDNTKHTFYGQDLFLSRFLKDVVWLKERSVEALNIINDRIACLPQRQPAAFPCSLVILLANAYFELTGAIPEVSYNGTENIAKGKVVTFISRILIEFGSSRSDRWIVDEIVAQTKAARSGQPKYANSIPAWIRDNQ